MNIILNTEETSRLLNAIYWCLSPYLDNDDDGIQERPWLLELAECYNNIISKLPDSCLYEHKILEL